jgi:hypothetical protein
MHQNLRNLIAKDIYFHQKNHLKIHILQKIYFLIYFFLNIIRPNIEW